MGAGNEKAELKRQHIQKYEGLSLDFSMKIWRKPPTLGDFFTFYFFPKSLEI